MTDDFKSEARHAGTKTEKAAREETQSEIAQTRGAREEERDRRGESGTVSDGANASADSFADDAAGGG